MATDDKPDVADRERELRDREQAVKEQAPHERSPDERSGDPMDDQDRPAPPGPEAQQPRG